MSAHGVLYVHSAPPALCPHIEWAVAGIVGAQVSMPWVGQPAAPGALRAELTWQARPGTAGAIASSLAGWNRLRFEVTEDSTPGPVRCATCNERIQMAGQCLRGRELNSWALVKIRDARPGEAAGQRIPVTL